MGSWPANNQLLCQEWVSLADLTIARTEHGLAVINGIPTVVGGVATDEFLASVEQLDSSNKEDVLYQREWRLVAQVKNNFKSLSFKEVNSGTLHPTIRLCRGPSANKGGGPRQGVQSPVEKTF